MWGTPLNRNKQKYGQKQLSFIITFQYFSTLMIFGFVSIVFFLILEFVLRQYTWYDTDFIYTLGKFLESKFYISIPLYALAGWTIITFRYFRKTLLYMDEVTQAASALTSGSEVPIQLSTPVKYIEDELNLVRERSIKSAAIAKEAEQRKNDLIVYLAHDLKTPLTSIIGYLTLLKDEQEISPSLRQKYTEIALRKSERLEDLINEFFDMTRFSLSHQALDLERINLTRMVEQMTFEFLPALQEKGLNWILQLEHQIEWVGDADKMQRVLDNLFRNAVNYSYPNTDISLGLLQVDDEMMELTVTNSGKTISSERLERIFEQFFRLDVSRTSATGGAGLGLAIAKEIVELHGGSISAESAEERITFRLRLPLVCHKIV